MERIKLTKHELKRFKESLRRYNRFLPTLNAKKQQLQREIVRIRGEMGKLEKGSELIMDALDNSLKTSVRFSIMSIPSGNSDVNG